MLVEDGDPPTQPLKSTHRNMRRPKYDNAGMPGVLPPPPPHCFREAMLRRLGFVHRPFQSINANPVVFMRRVCYGMSNVFDRIVNIAQGRLKMRHRERVETAVSFRWLVFVRIEPAYCGDV